MDMLISLSFSPFSMRVAMGLSCTACYIPSSLGLKPLSSTCVILLKVLLHRLFHLCYITLANLYNEPSLISRMRPIRSWYLTF